MPVPPFQGFGFEFTSFQGLTPLANDFRPSGACDRESFVSSHVRHSFRYLIATLVLLLAGTGDRCFAQTKYLGSLACARCHTEPQAQDKIADEQRHRRTDFVLLTEYVTWKERDKHSQAYLALQNERSQRMGKLLGVDVTTAAAGCIACHAMPFAEERRGDQFRIEDGVSCDGCHGPSSEWLTPHFTDKNWRTLPAAEKEQKGFLDVRNPIKRSKMCLSCHVGNAAEKKFVSHEMYAAGHPPLPGIELQTFCESLPKHWRNPGEKPEWVRRQLGHADGELYVTQSLLLGGAVALRQSLELLGATAARQDANHVWPELAQFDCSACHHDLRSRSWRQERGYNAAPGRPPFRSWPVALAKLSLLHAGRTAGDLDAMLKPVHLAVAAQPFGKPDEITLHAGKAVTWIDADLLAALGEKPCDRAAAINLLRALCDIAVEAVPEYDSARQLAWAFRAVYFELFPAAAARDPRVVQVLGQLEHDLQLKLPSRQRNETIEGSLAGSLRVIADYDPQSFRQQFQKLKSALGTTPGAALKSR